MSHRMSVAALIAVLGPAIALIGDAAARPVYAQETKRECGYCHLSSSGGGARGFRGRFYGANGLSFDEFDETREASLARCAPDSRAKATDAKVVYVQNATGPGAPHIQFMANQTPMIVIWVEPVIDPKLASAQKDIQAIIMLLGLRAGVVGVIQSDKGAALKATSDWGAAFRILPDAGGTAKKKYKATHAYDFALLKQGGDVVKLWSGYSRSNVEEMLLELTKLGIRADIPLTNSPSELVRGAEL